MIISKSLVLPGGAMFKEDISVWAQSALKSVVYLRRLRKEDLKLKTK